MTLDLAQDDIALTAAATIVAVREFADRRVVERAVLECHDPANHHLYAERPQ